MSKTNNFLNRLETKIKKQIKGDRVGFLLGAGSSYLDGDGYPLAGELWDKIKPLVPKKERNGIDAKLLEGADGLEHALDLLDSGGVEDTPHRHVVTDAIAQHFCTLRPPPELHGSFVVALQKKRRERAIPIFSLNYDPLIERACEAYLVRFVDGFVGVEQAYFDAATFQQEIVVVRRGARGLLSSPVSGVIKLFKLHGSLGWYECPTNGIRRCLFDADIPEGAKRLMIPPQHRKATDTMTPPYAQLWSEFRGMLRQGPILINRLVSIGYGMRDEHVNAVIENGLARENFNLIILARDLSPDSFARWSKWENAIVVTNNCCSMNGEIGPGHLDLWSFERISKEA